LVASRTITRPYGVNQVKTLLIVKK